MNKKLNYLLKNGAKLIKENSEFGEIPNENYRIESVDGDYIGLYLKNRDEILGAEIIYNHKLVNFQAVEKGSGKTVQIGFNEQEQAWYGWTHRGYGAFSIGYAPDDGCWIVEYEYVPSGYVAKTLEDCRQCATYMADFLD